MAAAKDSTAKRRAENRAKRRADAKAGPQATRENDGAATAGEHDVTDALRGAVSAAIAGAAVGAARALVQRRGRRLEEHDQTEEEVEPEAEANGDEVQPEPQPESEPESDREPRAEESETQDQQPPPRPEQRPQREDRRRKQAPLAGDQARDVVQNAREQLRMLRGVEPESVSSVTQTAGGWRVGLEVVELRRIPASTDVLATYEVELDPEGRLLDFERGSRYVRSEAERR